MKILGLFVSCLVALALVACGGSGSNDEVSSEPTTVSVAELNRLASSIKRPTIHIPPGPEPTKLEIKDLKVGTGPEVGEGKFLIVNYVAVSYRTGETIQEAWGPHKEFRLEFQKKGEVKAWEHGLTGMKAGGVRELRAPSRLTYGEGAVLYVIHMLAVE